MLVKDVKAYCYLCYNLLKLTCPLPLPLLRTPLPMSCCHWHTVWKRNKNIYSCWNLSSSISPYEHQHLYQYRLVIWPCHGHDQSSMTPRLPPTLWLPPPYYHLIHLPGCHCSHYMNSLSLLQLPLSTITITTASTLRWIVWLFFSPQHLFSRTFLAWLGIICFWLFSIFISRKFQFRHGETTISAIPYCIVSGYTFQHPPSPPSLLSPNV